MGPAIVPGHPEESLLVARLKAVQPSRRMPQESPTPLPAGQIEIIETWIKDGAAWPDETEKAPETPGYLRQKYAELKGWWAWQPLKNPTPPAVAGNKWSQAPIDRFILARLTVSHLAPVADADPVTLVRRLYFDLTGLPPAPADVQAFVKDHSPGAYAALVERLLASPQYGERWGRHWLDVVRFGESQGYEQNYLRPNAWPYRDYVIHAFNEDMPFDRFIREQLAGDVVGKGDPWADAATSFLVAGVHDTVGNQTEEGTRQQRANDLDDMVATTGEAFLGLTVGCAKCHDHKFDPIPQKDYYRLAAVFAGVRHGERPLGASGVTGPRRVENFTPVRARFIRFVITATNDGSEPCLDELEVYGPDGGANLARADAGGKATASSLLPGYAIHQIPHLNDGLLGNDHSWISAVRGEGTALIELPSPAQVGRVVWSRDGTPNPSFRDRTPTRYLIEVSEDGQSWKSVVQSGASQIDVRPGAMAYAGQFTAPDPIYLLRRGDVMQRGDEVTPGALSRVSALPADLASPTEPERRHALANWLTDPRNPLTSRVLVNRIWHYHFGRGIVGTPSDFGHNGERPTHPELLDWLASELMQNGWKLKQLQRLIVTSYAYQQ
jgi:hypothetical protein